MAYTGKFSDGRPSSSTAPGGKPNPEGVNYDVPAYAKSVATAYQTLKNGGQVSADPNNPSSTASPQITPKSSEGLPLLEKVLFGLASAGLGTVGLLASPETGGLSLGLEGEAGVLGAEALGDTVAGATDASTASTVASEATPSLLSKVKSGVSGVLGSPYAKAAEVLGAGDAIKGALGGSTQNSTPNTSDASTQSALDSSSAITKAIMDSASSTQSGNKLMQTQAGIEGAKTIGNNGYTPDVDENGRMIFAQAINDADKQGSELDETENQLLDAEGGKGSIADVAIKAKEIVRQTLPSTDWEEADKAIEREVEGYQVRMGGNEVPLGSEGIGRIRREGYKGYDRNSSTAKNGARKALGSAANHHMLEKTKHKELIGALHKEKQKLINAKKVMTHLNGKKAPENNGVIKGILRATGRDIALYIGDKIGGPIGAVIGAHVGNKLTKAIDKKFGKNEFESPALKKGLEILHKKSPHVYEAVKKELKKYEVEVEELQKREEHEKIKSVKRSVYKEKKKGILEGKSKEKQMPYVPLDQLPTIAFGKKAKSKEQKLKGLMTIR